MFIKIVYRIRDILDSHLKKYGAPINAFAIFCIINFPLFFLVWHYLTDEIYDGIGWRLLATILSIILLLRKYWPKVLRSWFAVYWYTIVTISFPLFSAYSFLESHGSIVWLTNGLLSIFLLILVADWLSFIIMLSIGVFLGTTIYLLQGHEIFFLYNPTSTFINYLWAIIIGAIFSRHHFRRQEKIELQNQVKTMKVLGASIAHELRTPLAAISLDLTTIKKVLSNESVPAQKIALAEKAVMNAIKQTDSASTIINMLLYKINPVIQKEKFSLCSINKSIEDALSLYPFDNSEREKVHWLKQQDFQFWGQHLLVVHVLFNLFKNAIHAIKAAGKGEITIQTDATEKYYTLTVKDTGLGLSLAECDHIFEQFYSKTHGGTGVGLAFCQLVLKSMGGKITCQSRKGKYTALTLWFPKRSDKERG